LYFRVSLEQIPYYCVNPDELKIIFKTLAWARKVCIDTTASPGSWNTLSSHPIHIHPSLTRSVKIMMSVNVIPSIIYLESLKN